MIAIYPQALNGANKNTNGLIIFLYKSIRIYYNYIIHYLLTKSPKRQAMFFVTQSIEWSSTMKNVSFKSTASLIGAVLLAMIVAFQFSATAGQKDARSAVDRREFKFLLKPELFQNPKEGYKKITSIALEAAQEAGVKLKLKSKQKRFNSKYRKIVFLDTKDFQIKKKGYALRVRTKYKKGRLKDSYEVTYKYRSTDPAIALKGIIKPSSLFASKGKFEQDVTMKQSDPKNPIMKFIYSKSAKIKNVQGDLTTIKDYSTLFKGLTALKLPGNTTLFPVNDIKYLERKIKPGYLHLGDGIAADFEMSIWYKNYSKEPTVSEVSYDYKIDNYYEKKDGAPSKRSEKFYKIFFKKLKEKGYLHTGSTKTDFTYRNATK